MSYHPLSDEVALNKSSDRFTSNVVDSTNSSNMQYPTSPGVLPDSRILNPISSLAASATIINLVLATGPFSYPYEVVSPFKISSHSYR